MYKRDQRLIPSAQLQSENSKFKKEWRIRSVQIILQNFCRLRALYQVEDSLVLTLVVGCGVMVFAVVYTGVLLLLFTVGTQPGS